VLKEDCRRRLLEICCVVLCQVGDHYSDRRPVGKVACLSRIATSFLNSRIEDQGPKALSFLAARKDSQK
jgi:hypothetical protein